MKKEATCNGCNGKGHWLRGPQCPLHEKKEPTMDNGEPFSQQNDEQIKKYRANGDNEEQKQKERGSYFQ